MSSIYLRLRKADAEIEKLASKRIKVDDTGNDFFLVPIWLKKASDGVFAEMFYEDLPQDVINQLDKPEKIY